MKNKIRNLKELKAAKRKLEIQREASKQLFFESLSETRSQTARLLTTRLILPAGAAGLAAWGAKKVFSGNGQHPPQDDREDASSHKLTGEVLRRLLPVGLSLLTAWLDRRETAEDEI